MESTALNPTQRFLLQLFARNGDEERLKELKTVTERTAPFPSRRIALELSEQSYMVDTQNSYSFPDYPAEPLRENFDDDAGFIRLSSIRSIPSCQAIQMHLP
jgi:hypothetical protein